eukprot:gb/GFBE01001281.1/.p1 GENE.gb/GFBE01001281.1/~~gb/GFBE01001281.1/.p1  ORF type:complete len:243 (+),score=74.98 gb/GFBE01001281.1/:1-729(+)
MSTMMQQGGVVYMQAPGAAYGMAPQAMPMQGMMTPGAMSFPAGMAGMAAPNTARMTSGMLPMEPRVPSMAPPMTSPGAADASGYLQQYFQMVRSALAINSLNSKAAMRELNGKLFPIIVEAFKCHDRDGDLVLDRNEAYAFFSHFVSERLGFHEVAGGLIHRHAGDKDKAADILENYMRNKARMDQAAFRVFNSDEDGYLQMHEVVQALTLGTPEHKKLLEAFGFHSEVEEEEAHYYADHYA